MTRHSQYYRGILNKYRRLPCVKDGRAQAAHHQPLLAQPPEEAVRTELKTSWLQSIRRYILATSTLHLLWEILQLPLYTIWTAEPRAKQAFAVLHCTIGDVMIASLTLLIALALFGRAEWPSVGSKLVWLTTMVLGAGYTVYSEWLNVNVRGTWAYAPSMPTVPVIGTGLAPLLQWLIVPTLVLWIATARRPWQGDAPD